MAAAPNENTTPSTGMGVVRKPTAVQISATTESKMDTSAIGADIRPTPAPVK
jgi:hypothetical protein